MPARYIQPAEPVYQVQPPRPTWRRLGVDVAGQRRTARPCSGGSPARVPRVVDRVEQREQLGGLVAVAQRGEGEHAPDRGVGVLAAVLAHAGQVALDVAGIERRVVERRREEQDQPVAAAHQELVDRRHGARRARRVGGARDHRPGLGDRVDPALVVRGRAERRAVVEVGAPVPVAVPGLALERRLADRAAWRAPGRGARAPRRALRPAGRSRRAAA